MSAHTQSGWGWLQKLKSMPLSGAKYLITVLTVFPLNRSYTVLALSSESALGATFDGVPFFPSKFWDAEDRIVLGYISSSFGLSLHVLGNVSLRRGPWTLM